MAKSLIFLNFLLFSQLGFANFQSIVAEALKTNADVKTSELSFLQSQNLADKVSSQNAITLFASAGQESGQNVGLFNFQSQETTSEIGTIGLSKKFLWGGTLSLSHSLEYRDISKWTTGATATFPSGTAYFHTNTISYEQDLWKDFIGRHYRSQVRANKLLQQQAKEEVREAQASLVLKLFQYYHKAKLEKKILELTMESEKRAKQRKDLIDRRLRDGISLKVDALRAKSQLIQIQETVRQEEVELKRALVDLSTELNRQVKTEEVNNFDKRPPFYPVPVIDFNQIGGIELEVLRKSIAVAREELYGLKTQTGPDLTLNFEMNRASVNNDRGDSFSDAISDDTYDTKSITLNLTYPFGTSSQKVDEVNKRLEVQKLELKKSSFVTKSQEQARSLLTEVEEMKQNVSSSLERVDLSEKVLSEQSKRYSRGQIDLDQLLNAEEDMLVTSRSYYTNVYNYYLTLASIYYLAGNVEKILQGYDG